VLTVKNKKMKIKSLIIFAVLVTAIFGFSLASAPKAQAAGCMLQLQSLSAADQMQCLQQYVSELMQQIATLQAQQQPSQIWCHTFNQNLGFAQSGSAEVQNLQIALQQQNIHPMGAVNGIYDEQLAQYVTQFQTKYGIHPSGYFGYQTRIKMNSLYGCQATATSTTCTPNWQCSDWSRCLSAIESSSGLQTRTCTDLNYCGINDTNTAGGAEPIKARACSTATTSAGILQTPTFVASQSTPAQYIMGNRTSQIALNFSATGSVTITELKFNVYAGNELASTAIMNICAGNICAQPVNGVATLAGLNIPVQTGSINQSIIVRYAPVGVGEVNSGTLVHTLLSSVKYTSDGVSNLMQTSISTPTMTLVGSIPTVTIPTTTNGPLMMRLQNEIGRVAVVAPGQGAIKINTITFNVSNSGITGFSLTNPVLLERTYGNEVGSGCIYNSSTSTIACKLGNNYSEDYYIAAGAPETFSLRATINGTATSGASVSTSLAPGAFVWDDTATNGQSGIGFTGGLIPNFPTNNYIISTSGSTTPPTTPTITVTLPNSGTYKIGDTINITWNYSGISSSSSASITFYYQSNNSDEVNRNTFSAGIVPIGNNRLDFVIPSNVAPGNYRMQISDWVTANQNVAGNSSGLITITAPTASTQPTIDHLSSSSATVGSQVTIYGTNLGSSAIAIIYPNDNRNNGINVCSYGCVANSSGTSLTFTVPQNTVAGNYSLATFAQGSSISSNNVSLTITSSATQPSITVTSPNGGETWRVGETHNITWTSSGMPSGATVSIGINGDGSSSTMSGGQIATNVPVANGSYQWTIPTFLGENLADKKYDVYVNYVGNGGSSGDNSNGYFSISAPTIACTTNAQCGAKVSTSTPYCQGNSVYQNFTEKICFNPGTTNARCGDMTGSEEKSVCASNQVCESGACKQTTTPPALTTNLLKSNYSIVFTLNSTTSGFTHNMTLTTKSSTGNGAFSGTGYYVATPAVKWNVSGTQINSNVTFQIVYTGQNPGYTLNATGTINADGTISGTASSTAGNQNFTWRATPVTTVGTAQVNNDQALASVSTAFAKLLMQVQSFLNGLNKK
jgi:hypothetical protein